MKTLSSVLKIGSADSAGIDQTKRSLYQRHVCVFVILVRALGKRIAQFICTLYICKQVFQLPGKKGCKGNER